MTHGTTMKSTLLALVDFVPDSTPLTRAALGLGGSAKSKCLSVSFYRAHARVVEHGLWLPLGSYGAVKVPLRR